MRRFLYVAVIGLAAALSLVPAAAQRIQSSGGAAAAASSLSTPSGPAGRTSLTLAMAGLAGAITPATTGRVLYTISGTAANATVNDGCTIQLRHGTGTAPTTAAAVTGTTDGAAQSYVWAAGGAPTGFSITGVVTGLAVGTAVWLDLSYAAVTAGTCNLSGITIAAVEL